MLEELKVKDHRLRKIKVEDLIVEGYQPRRKKVEEDY